MANVNLRIPEVCKAQGTTIAALADKLNIKAQSLSQAIYRGSFSLDKLGEIADALGVTVPELFEAYKPTGIKAYCHHCGKAISISISKAE